MSDRFSRLFRRPDSAALPPFEASFERGSISEQVADRIMTMVKAGELKAGDRLPTESQMTLALGISRPPLREALKALVLMGVLESRQGSRYSVTDLSPSRLVEPFNVMLAGTGFDPLAYLEARSVVDLECARLCALRACPERKAEIGRYAAEGPAVVGDPIAFRALDRLFHGAIYAGSGNVFLETVARGLYTAAIHVRDRAAVERDLVARSCAQHIEIADAILAGDAEASVATSREHLEHIRVSIRRALDLTKAGRPRTEGAASEP